MSRNLFLKQGRVIDIAQSMDCVADVAIAAGKISAIGKDLEVPPDAQVLDLSGKIVSPGLFDIHVHAYGGIAFADPDSIGVNLGTTSMVDAGGAGAYSWDEFEALIVGQTRTDVYLWLLMGAAGIFGLTGGWRNAGSLIDIPINKMINVVEKNRDVIVGLKMACFAALGMGPMKMARGLADVLNLPLYMHIGDIFESPEETFTAQILDLLEPGDYVTHMFTSCPGNLLDGGEILPEALSARDRGVWFDTGFGGFNFSFDVAERMMDKGFVPDTISSDLQQINVTGPVHSLTHMMSAMMALGMSLSDVLRRVTVNPAEQLGLTHKAGALKPGMPADVTVIEVQAGDFEFRDAAGGSRRDEQLLAPVLTIKAGEVIHPDRELAESESNWSMEGSISYDEVPQNAALLDSRQRIFLGQLAEVLKRLDEWDGVSVHDAFHGAWRHSDINLRRAAEAVFHSFMTSRFTPPVGFFLAMQDRDFVLTRLQDVARGPRAS